MGFLACLTTVLWSAIVPADTTERVVVREISIVGNYRTRERIIRRELLIQEGDTLTQKRFVEQLELDRRKVQNTNLFITTEVRVKPVVDSLVKAVAQVLPTPKTVDVEIVVKEQFYLIPYPIFSLADRNFNEWWYDRGRSLKRVVYGTHVNFQNVTGNNDRLRLIAEFGFIPRFELSYGLPYLDKSQRTGLFIGMVYLTNKTIAYRTRADKLVFLNSEERTRERFVPSITLTHRRKFYGFHSLNLLYSVTNLADTVAKLNPNYFLEGRINQRYAQLTYTYFYDRRDRVQYPLRGHLWAAQLSRTGLLPTDDWQQWDVTANIARFVPLGKNFFASFSAEVKISSPSRQPFLQTRGLGYGGDLVRGYELYVIDGQGYAYARNSLKYRLLDKLYNLKFIKIRQFNTFPLAMYPTVFCDFGYVSNRFTEINNSKLANRLLIGGGFGLDFVTWYNFVMRVNYSFNHLGEGRPFFSIGREF